MPTPGASRRRDRGEVEVLPSGGLRVRVYAGVDPLTGKRNYLTETVTAGPTAAREAEKARVRLLNKVDERRAPSTRATLNQLLDKWLEVAELETSTRVGYLRKIERHVRPVLGDLRVARLDAATLESYYATLRRCRDRCDGRTRAEHHTRARHTCDERCTPHICRGLAPATVRQIHSIVRAALERAVRWGWIGTNPAAVAVAPALPRPNPSPPSGEQAARILTEAWKDPRWGLFIWLAVVTGARRGELCALRWRDLEAGNGVLVIRGSLGQNAGEVYEKSTKTHQQRRIALDATTLALLDAWRREAEADAAAVDVELAEDCWVFSPQPDAATPMSPNGATQRYSRMCERIGIRTHLHALRHYSATELIAAGVDVRTVAGRLGHSGGGTTTLRVYSAWRSEADQRAARDVVGRLPAPPITITEGEPVLTATPAREDNSPYRRIAADLRGAITCGVLRPGEPLPTLVQICERYGVASSTANRAVAVLVDARLVTVSRGKRTVVTDRS